MSGKPCLALAARSSDGRADELRSMLVPQCLASHDAWCGNGCVVRCRHAQWHYGVRFAVDIGSPKVVTGSLSRRSLITPAPEFWAAAMVVQFRKWRSASECQPSSEKISFFFTVVFSILLAISFGAGRRCICAGPSRDGWRLCRWHPWMVPQIHSPWWCIFPPGASLPSLRFSTDPPIILLCAGVATAGTASRS